MGVLCWSLFCGVVLGAFSSFEEVRVGCFTLCCGCLCSKSHLDSALGWSSLCDSGIS